VTYVRVAVPAPLWHSLTYRVPDSMPAPARGKRVLCRMRQRPVVAVVLEVLANEPEEAKRVRIEPILEVLTGPYLPEELLAFLERLASYYLAPIGEVCALALPPLDRETERALAEPTLFDKPSKGVALRQVQWLGLTDEGRELLASFRALSASKPDGTQEPVEADDVVSAFEEPTRPKKRTLADLHILALLAEGDKPLGEVVKVVKNARSVAKRLGERGALRLFVDDKPFDPFASDVIAPDAQPTLNEEQRAAESAINEAIVLAQHETFLLRGVTGSGKTEVYFAAIAKASAVGKGVLILVPEIALTPQLVRRYRARFGNRVAVLHSGLSSRDRYVMWMQLLSGEFTVAIGARSALFAPVSNLGLIVVDEEHDPSFKQEDGVRYHARDMAILRAHRANAVVVLGSATPSLESEHAVETGKAKLIELRLRAQKQALPEIEVVDLRKYPRSKGEERLLSLPLLRAIEQTLTRGEQTILFLNRRGFSPNVMCQACGVRAECPNCSIALTLHRARNSTAKPDSASTTELVEIQGSLRCHYCDYEETYGPMCAHCNSDARALLGLGTEKLEHELGERFPSARVARLDRDVSSAKQSEAILAKMRDREIDILVGTQMVAKGHDFPAVTLVGVVNADAALGMPDFRAAERAFQLMVQVAGRAGRGDLPGKVLVQTYDPAHPVIAFGRGHDILGFRKAELISRAELGYPPFSRMVFVRLDSLSLDDVEAAARWLADELRVRLAHRPASLDTPKTGEGVFGSARSEVEVLGPAVAPIARLRNRHRFRVVIRSKDRNALRQCAVLAHRLAQELASTVRVVIDVDPQQAL
jgi:primosomal protein N' (replication factor Y) (superfamily II helicase)